MEGQRKKGNPVFWNCFPFLLAAAVGILYHIKIRPMTGDDVFFSQALSEQDWWSYLVERYETWTSRFVIEGLLVLIVRYPLVWKLLDAALFATLPLLLARIFGGGRLMNWCAAGAMLLYLFHDMGSAGWITTTINYFLPVWGLLFVGLLMKKIAAGEKIRLPEGIFGVLICLIASSHEQVAVILFVIFVLYGFWALREKHRAHGNRAVLFCLVLVNIASLISILLCPGNAGRNAVSIADLPVFETYGFGDKLYLGLLSIERVFIANCDALFFVVVLILALLIYVKTENYVSTLIASFPLFILFGQTVLRTAYPGLSGIFVVPGQITEWSWGACLYYTVFYPAVCHHACHLPDGGSGLGTAEANRRKACGNAFGGSLPYEYIVCRTVLLRTSRCP